VVRLLLLPELLLLVVQVPEWRLSKDSITFLQEADNLYIKVDGKKIWPDAGKYKDINSQQTKEIGYSFSMPTRTTIELFEYDSISSDDKLGYLIIPESHNAGYFTYAVKNEDEGSIYE
jgi:hypothetical protein